MTAEVALGVRLHRPAAVRREREQKKKARRIGTPRGSGIRKSSGQTAPALMGLSIEKIGAARACAKRRLHGKCEVDRSGTKKMRRGWRASRRKDPVHRALLGALDALTLDISINCSKAYIQSGVQQSKLSFTCAFADTGVAVLPRQSRLFRSRQGTTSCRCSRCCWWCTRARSRPCCSSPESRLSRDR